MSDRTPGQRRAELAESDKELPELAFATRPLFGVPGVLVQVLDASRAPYEHVFEGRVNPRQAEGLAHDLGFMVRLQRLEPDVQLVDPAVRYEEELVERVARWGHAIPARGRWEDETKARREAWLAEARRVVRGS